MEAAVEAVEAAAHTPQAVPAVQAEPMAAQVERGPRAEVVRDNLVWMEQIQ